MRCNWKTSAAITNICLVFGILIVSACRCGSDDNVNREVPRGENDAVTTVIIVRHAEKAAEPAEDPQLSGQGIERANLLTNMLINKNVTAIYTSRYRRARETASPLADESGIVPIEINEAELIVRSILENNSGQTILVVAHTDTIPEIIKNLGGKEIEPISEADFGSIFTVALTPNKPADVIKNRY